MNKPGILFSTACYHSAPYAIRLVRSLRHIPGRNMAIITCARAEDAAEVAAGLEGCEQEHAVFLSALDSSYFCKNYGFLCAVMMGMLPRWFCSCDDDIEFWPSAERMPARLDRAQEKYDFSLMAFRNPNQQYAGGTVEDGYRISPGWLDGNALFSSFYDNLKFGIPDSVPGEKITFYVELEYQHRLEILKGRPLVVDVVEDYYLHHFRVDPALRERRNPNDVAGMTAGSRLWDLKYGLEVGDWNSPGVHARIKAHVSRPEAAQQMRRMILYGTETLDWKSAVKYAAEKVTLIRDRIRW